MVHDLSTYLNTYKHELKQMAFPVSPTEGQTFTENNTVWIYSAVMGQWNRSVINPLNETLYEFGGSATATGNAGEIQYTDGTNLAASPNLLWDNANNELEVGGDVVLDDGGTYTTTLQTITPTANRTISLPNATGTVALVAGSSGQLVYNNAGAQAGAPGSVVGATGNITLSLNGAASVPPVAVTGTWFVGTTPQVQIQPSNVGTTGAWSASGTAIGVNAVTGFTGRLLDLQLNGTSNFNVDSTGRVSFPLGLAATPSLYPGTDTNTGIYSPGPDQVALSTGGTGRLFVDASGNVGVAAAASTWSQGKTLEISGTKPIALWNPGDGFNALSNIYFNSGYKFSTTGEYGLYYQQNTGLGAHIFAISTVTGSANGTATFLEALRITSAGRVGIGVATPSSLLHLADAGDITVGTTTGTKIGTATTQKLGFYNKTPVVQPAAVADATTSVDVITQFNALLARMRDLGLIAT